MERVVCIIAGPTCAGKTDVGISLAQKLNGEIISADSRQVFKHLNIGTAKPSKEKLGKVKHHFIGELEPDVVFNASKFELGAIEKINKIFDEGKTPIVVGGSGLYIKALVDGIMNNVDTDFEYRNELYALREKFGNEYLYKNLEKVDPKSAEEMLPQNWKRVIRSLEVFHLTGKPIWVHQKEFVRKIDFEFVQFGLSWKRKMLYHNINKRVDIMVENGLVEEVKEILKLGFSKELYALNTVGYKEIISYLDGEFDLERAVELIKRNTRRYAKKQMTWFRACSKINWLQVEGSEDIDKIASEIAGSFKV
ncbi:MAG: tRNA delta(2)-isopentenylpyrophosphate transferase [Ignavibacteria bacterium]|nr:MAG: tRNA delta(2)-isopentenylpyrophosphate transferase [Ignavibacteria bacterium]KAF0161147.1 MAG: tRNA delta(2)-isopentenylpyrophosphate transferase [Ignavibacteria bacterium]